MNTQLERQNMKQTLDVIRAHDVCERLFLSVCQLATGKGDIRERLASISATLLPLRNEDFPAELQVEYERITKRLTKYPARHNYESAVDASCKRMKNRTGQIIAESIVALYQNAMEIQKKQLI